MGIQKKRTPPTPKTSTKKGIMKGKKKPIKKQQSREITLALWAARQAGYSYRTLPPEEQTICLTCQDIADGVPTRQQQRYYEAQYRKMRQQYLKQRHLSLLNA